MTANELADLNEWSCCAHSKQVSAMLRQQAQEIAMLKQIIDANNLQSDIGQLKKELALQRLSDIGQEIENEPVAWMLLGLEDRKPKLINPQVIEHLEGTWIPLYTHPNEDRDSAIYATGYWKGIDYKRMRELTNEEIMEVANEVFNTYQNWGYYQIDFARAILKKASEK